MSKQKEALVCSVLAFGIDRINNLKFKELQVLLRYHFGSERLNGIPDKVELVEAVTDLIRRDWEDLMQRVSLGCLVVTNEV